MDAVTMAGRSATMAGRSAKAETPRRLKAKASNNWLVLDGVDNRTSFYRRFRDVALGIAGDLGIEDIETAGNTLKLQIRGAAYLAAQVEQLQSQAARGEQIDQAILGRMEGRLDRKLWGLGLTKRRRTTLGAAPGAAVDPQERSVLPAAPMSQGISRISAHVNRGEVVGPKRLGRSLGPAGRTFFGGPISSFRKTVSSPLPRA